MELVLEEIIEVAAVAMIAIETDRYHRSRSNDRYRTVWIYAAVVVRGTPTGVQLMSICSW